MARILLIIVLLFNNFDSWSDPGNRLWLRYDKLDNALDEEYYKSVKNGVWVSGNSPTVAIINKEFELAFTGLFGRSVSASTSAADASIIIANRADKTLTAIAHKIPTVDHDRDGFVILSTILDGKKKILITANSDLGLLYGTYHFLRLLQTQQSIANLSVVSTSKVKLRILNHWDNLDGTVERGYAGSSIWDWQKLPFYISPRYHEYARANASIGINGTVLTNVNSNALILSPMYLEKVKALADVFRPYGIKVYLTARFNAPMELGGLKTADPLDESVQVWWKEKVSEIYKYVPDFGGFLVKANSEGQPGPQNYGRSHADGANLLAKALKPHGGIVMWRAFVYNHEIAIDRTKQAYDEFKPLDGKFDDNVILQVKNGPLDFQPREPFHPLFGAIEKTPVMPEFQITQEYLGFSTHLVYLGTLFKECLDSDTYAKGKGSTVAKAMDGSLFNHRVSAIAGVANIGSDLNWTGHQFGQANWYAFGRLAWDHQLTAAQVADEWTRQTFTNEDQYVSLITKFMLSSRETTVKYMTPLGLHHIMGYDHHYGPGPWVAEKPRADWTSVYYHRADSLGVGYDRTATGSNALEQYSPEIRAQYANVNQCPEELLLWFHHVPWNFKMKSGHTLWDKLCYEYYDGVERVKKMKADWQKLRSVIDDERFEQVDAFIAIQLSEASLWRDACVLYFQQFAKQDIPRELTPPTKTLEEYKALSFPYAPGIKPKW